jgi:hypothetical protein
MEAHIAIRILKLSDFITLSCLNSKWHSEVHHPSIAARALLNIYPPYYAACKLLAHLSRSESEFTLKILEYILTTCPKIPLSPTLWKSIMSTQTEEPLKLLLQCYPLTKEQTVEGLSFAVSISTKSYKILLDHLMTTVPYAEISELLTHVVESSIHYGNNEALEHLLTIVHLSKTEWQRLVLVTAVHRSNFDAIRLICEYTHSIHSQFLSNWAVRIQHYPLLKEFPSEQDLRIVNQLQLSHAIFCRLLPSINRWVWLIPILFVFLFIPLTIIAIINSLVAIIVVYMVRNHGICQCSMHVS